jgi:hypothetical protein
MLASRARVVFPPARQTDFREARWARPEVIAGDDVRASAKVVFVYSPHSVRRFYVRKRGPCDQIAWGRLKNVDPAPL